MFLSPRDLACRGCGLRRQHHLIEVLGEHRRGEEGHGAQGLLAGVLEIVAQRRRQHKHAARPNLVRRPVFEIKLTLAGDDVLRLFGSVGVPAEAVPGLDL
jgi:hypothetical protein